MPNGKAIHRFVRWAGDLLERRPFFLREQRRDTSQVSDDIFQAIPSGVYLYDYEPPDRLTLVDGNPAATRLTGVDAQAWKGREFEEVWPGAGSTGIKGAYLTALRTGKPFETEDYFYKDARFSGTFRVRAFALPGDRLAVVFEDVTEKKGVERELREHSLRLEAAISAGHVGLWEWDIPTDSVYYSPEWKKQLGYQDHEIADDFEEWRCRVHPDDLEPTLSAIQENLRSQQSFYQIEFRMRHKSGAYRWILTQATIARDEAGNPVRACGTHVDITERKQTEDALRTSEELHRALIETLPDVVMRFDREGRHLYVSDNVTNLHGVEPGYLLGKTFRDLEFDEGLCRQFEESIQEVMEKGYALETEYATEGRNGPSVYNLRVIPERDVQGTVHSVLCLSRDITAYRQAEQDYRTLFNEMLNGFALHEILCDQAGKPVDYRYIAVNPAFERITGLNAEALVGRTVMEVMPETERYWIDTYGKVALTGEPAYFEHHSGALRKHFEVTAFRPRPNHFACIFEDCTERKSAGIALLKSESELRAIYESAPTMMCVLDTSRQVLYANRAFVEFVGQPEEAIKNTRACGVIGCLKALDHPNGCGHGPACSQCAVRLSIEDAVANGRSHRGIEYRTEIMREGKPQEFVFLASVAPIAVSSETHVLLCLEDITARQQALSALRDSEARFRGIVDNTQAGYFFIDYQGCFRSVNAAWLTMHGYDSADEVLSKHYSMTQLPADLPASRRVVETVLAGIPVPDGELSRLCRDGAIGYHTYTVRPVFQGGEVIGLEGFIIDTTERREAEEHRKKLESQLRQSQKMEAIGQLAGGVAHDFNNLLQVILGNVDLMKDGLDISPQNEQPLREVRKAAQRAADLTRQLLAFGRRQVIQPVTFDLNDLVEGVLKMIRRIIGEHIELVFKPGTFLHSVYADKGQIEQVLINLCVNARDAMPTGGTLAIETGRITVDGRHPEVEWGLSKGPYEVLTVSDTGHGMDEETRAQIFEPFFTTKEVGHGTGLGLATVYGIVKQHRGSINVYSEPDVGSVFRIYLPSVAPAQKSATPDSDADAPGGSETILVAEDEEDVRKLIRRLLQGAGYTVLIACNGEDALRIYEENAASIDMVILDVIMPKMGGQQTMERILSRHPKTRFLFSSGYSADALHKGFRIEPGVRLVAKPYSREELLRAVREALDAPGKE